MFRDVVDNFVDVYLGDILVFSNVQKERLRHSR